MEKRWVLTGLITIIMILSGCNVSDYAYMNSEDEVKQICDEETKICYPVEEAEKDTEIKEEGENREEFNREFEKLREIVDDMNKEIDEDTKTQENLEKITKETTEEEKKETVKEEKQKTENKETKKEEENKETAEEKETNNSTPKSLIRVYEGELVKLNVKSTDPDGDKLTYTFSNPLNKNGEWQTKIGDRGRYPITVSVSDGQYKLTKEAVVEVLKVNRPPVLELIPDIEVYEGVNVVINAKATDPDDDPLTYTYSGWMNSNKKATNYDDAGEYKVTVTVTDDDGESDSQVVNIKVKDKNRAPSMGDIELI